MKISQLATFIEYHCHLNFRSLICVFTDDCCSLFGSFSSTYIPWKICPKLPSGSTSSPWIELSSPWIFQYRSPQLWPPKEWHFSRHSSTHPQGRITGWKYHCWVCLLSDTESSGTWLRQPLGTTGHRCCLPVQFLSYYEGAKQLILLLQETQLHSKPLR